MKKIIGIGFVVFLFIFVVSSSYVSAHPHHGDWGKDVKKGILLVTFGTSIPEAKKSFDNIDSEVKKAFPGVSVYWAYTSSIIRKKLSSEGNGPDSVEMALARMMDMGFTHVAVQSLHTIRGKEYDDLEGTVKAFSHIPGGFENIALGAPLLGDQKDLEKVCDAVLENIPKERGKKDAVVLMGHGSPHPSNAFYMALMYLLQQKDPLVFVGTVEGYPEIDDIKGMLKEKKVKKAWLVPFMSVAGDHARNDMAGDEEDSWKSVLSGDKIIAVPVLKGTAEYSNMVSIWIDHLKDTMKQIED